MFHSDIECVAFAENVYQDQGEIAQISDEKKIHLVSVKHQQTTPSP